ncbi:MAG: histidine phosphatase family protein [Verrucomicrobiota bacterium]|nr:histidine phosphatase family protein [Verrucomicrobiota bacterium]
MSQAIKNSFTTRLAVVRHGETIWNQAGRFQGHKDSPLTEEGLAQAQALSRRFLAGQWHFIFSSDLGRAKQTALPITKSAGLKLQTDSRLRERCLGIFEGLTRQEAVHQYPTEFNRYISGDPDYALPKGQSIREHLFQTVGCLEELARTHADKNLIIITHGGSLSALFRHVVGLPLNAPRHYEITNASFNSFLFGSDGWKLETWGDLSHLGALPEVEEEEISDFVEGSVIEAAPPVSEPASETGPSQEANTSE